MLLSIILIAACASQSVPQVSPACQAFITEQAKTVESTCGNVGSTTVSNIKDLFKTLQTALPKICTDACDNSLKQVIEKVKANPDCADQKSTIESYGNFRAAVCTKTSDGKAFCLDKQIPILTPILEKVDPQNPTAALSLVLSNKELVCTDCLLRQLAAVQSVPALTATVNDPKALLDQTCRGKYDTVSGESKSSSSAGALSASFSIISGLLLAF